MANNRGVNKSAQAYVKCLAPDVCWTPAGKGKKKVAYEIISRFDVSEKTAGTVNFGSLPVFNMGSRLPTVQGNEEGTLGGVISGVNLGYCRPIDGSHSKTVRVENQWLIRNGDIMAMNCDGPDGKANTYGKITFVNLQEKASVNEDGQIIDKQEQIETDEDGNTVVRQAESKIDPETGQETRTVHETHINPETGQIQTQELSQTLDPSTGQVLYESALSGDFNPDEFAGSEGESLTPVEITDSPGGFDGQAGGSGGDGLAPVEIENIGSNSETDFLDNGAATTDIVDNHPDILNDPEYQAALADQQALEQQIADLNAEIARETAITALDVVGTFEPTPTCDMASAALSLQGGDYLGASLSVISSIIPYFGDALAKPLKAMRTAKKVAKLMSMLENLALKSKKIQHTLDSIKDRLKKAVLNKKPTKANPPKATDGGNIPGNQSKGGPKNESTSSGKSDKENSNNDKASKKSTEESARNNEDLQKGDPVNCVTGEVLVNQTDFTLPGRIPLTWSRRYGSQNSRSGLCGHGWQTPADARLTKNADGIVTFYDGVGKGRVFVSLPDQRPVLEEADGAWLTRKDNALSVTLKSGISYHFTQPEDDFNEILVERIQDRNDNYLAFDRPLGDLHTIRDNCHRRINIETEQGRIRRMILETPDGQSRLLVSYDYNREGDLTSVRNPLNAPHRFFYTNHCLVKQTNRAGLTFNYTYDETQGKCIRTWGDNGLYDYCFEYEPGQTVITNSLGFKEIYAYDKNFLPLVVTDHEGNQTKYAYDDAGRTTAVTDPSGKRTAYLYNRFGNPVAVTRNDAAMVTFEYDKHQQPICIVDPNGSQWKQRWDEKGRLIEKISPRGASEKYAYNNQGDLISVTDPYGAVTIYEPDTYGNTCKITNPLGRYAYFSFDEMGNIVSAKDTSGAATAYTYDLNSRLIRMVTPSGNRIQCRYDDQDRLVDYIDEAGGTTRFEYTGMDQLARRMGPDDTCVRYAYDSEDQLVAVTNQRGETYKLTRDYAGRVIHETDYWGQKKTYNYDAAGRLVTSIDPLGRGTTYEYDLAGRLLEKIRDDGSAESFCYDTIGNLLSNENDHITVQRVFDKEHRIIKETSGAQRIINAYDLNGRRIKRRSSHGNRVKHFFDTAGQLQAVSINGQRILDINRYHKQRSVTEQLLGGMKRHTSFDAQGLLRRQIITAPAHVVADRHYSYDPLGNLIRKQDAAKGTDYFTCNPAGRIIEHVNPEDRIKKFLYDPAGDLSMPGSDSTYARSSVYEDTRYDFDQAGNLVQRISPEKGRTDFKWDHDNRLISAQSDYGLDVTMNYDAQGRRIEKDVNGKKTQFCWDGNALLSDNIDDAGPREFVYYPGTFEPLAVIDSNKDILYFHNDHIGAPQEITTTEGNIVWSARYQPLGGIDEIIVNEFDNPLRLQGQYYDPEIDLCYNRFRYFDPRIGAFISQDPLGLAAGENLYAYAPNVWGWIDPLGLCKDTSEKPKFPDDPNKTFPEDYPGMNKTEKPDGKIVYEVEAGDKNYKVEFHPEHGGTEHYAGDHYHVKKQSDFPPPGKTKPVDFRIPNKDPNTPATPGGGTFAPGDLLPTENK